VCDLYIVGLGIRGTEQITPEAGAALRACRKVYFGAEQRGIAEYLQRYGCEVEDLYALAEPGASRPATYQRMADKVLQAARERPPVGFAVYGHPMILVLPTRLIRQQAPELGLSVKVIPGVSALDCLLADLGFDPCERGLIQYEATYALLYQPPLDPAAACLLWQAGMAETVLYDLGVSRPGRFRRLSDYLARFHPGGHRVALAISPRDPLDGPIIAWLTIDELREAHEDVMSGATLFIPPSSEPEVSDKELESLLADPAHLVRISRRRTEVDAFKRFLRRMGSRTAEEG
jgi:hypothetical protein